MPARASAKTINFSRDGMYFISDMSFHPGSTVFIRAKNESSHQNMPENTEGLRQTTIAEVRWCMQVSEKPSRYEVGVSIMNPGIDRNVQFLSALFTIRLSS
jgi:hypothetical protein